MWVLGGEGGRWGGKEFGMRKGDETGGGVTQKWRERAGISVLK